MSKLIYSYDGDSKEFLSAREAIVNPRNSLTYLMPANTTLVEPLGIKEGYVSIFDAEQEVWFYEIDLRGTKVFNCDSKAESTISYLGAIEDDYTTIEPLELSKWDYEAGEWVIDNDLVIAKQVRDNADAKSSAISNLVITSETILFDGNGEALGNMSTVISVANATFNRLISEIKEVDGEMTVMSNSDAYQFVYKDSKINWKGADNLLHEINIEQLVEASRVAMQTKAEIIYQYSTGA